MNGMQVTGTSYCNDTSHSELTPDEKLQRSTRSFMHPDEVLSDFRLTHADKREILASWACDVRAVPNRPALRQLDNGAVVHIDDVLQALNSLSEGDYETLTLSYASRASEGRLLQFRTHSGSIMRRSWSDDDDDDLPPCPVVSAGPLAGPLFGGEAVDPVLTVAA